MNDERRLLVFLVSFSLPLSLSPFLTCIGLLSRPEVPPQRRRALAARSPCSTERIGSTKRGNRHCRKNDRNLIRFCLELDWILLCGKKRFLSRRPTAKRGRHGLNNGDVHHLCHASLFYSGWPLKSGENAQEREWQQPLQDL